MPNPEMRNRPAGHGTADRKADFKEHAESTETVRAASLRGRFAIDYCVAAALAPLIWGLPR
jgi:hypothetical protein